MAILFGLWITSDFGKFCKINVYFIGVSALGHGESRTYAQIHSSEGWEEKENSFVNWVWVSGSTGVSSGQPGQLAQSAHWVPATVC